MKNKKEKKQSQLQRAEEKHQNLLKKPPPTFPNFRKDPPSDAPLAKAEHRTALARRGGPLNFRQLLALVSSCRSCRLLWAPRSGEGIGFFFSSEAEDWNSAGTDRAATLDEVVDYVNFLRMQVKIISMSGLCGSSAMAQLVAKVPLRPSEKEAGEARNKRELQDKLLNDGTGRKVVKLTEEDIGASMQFLQSKALCVVPISSVATICHSPHHQQPKPPLVKIPDAEAPS